MPGAPRTNPAAPSGAPSDLTARLRRGAEALREQLNRREELTKAADVAMYRAKDSGKNAVVLATKEHP